jgi:hypothetical protein
VSTKLLQTFVLGVAFGTASCSSTSSPSDQGSGGSNAQGAGGNSTAGSSGGSKANGGSTAAGGSANGGSGTSSGGSTAAGGSANGGSGTSTGGAPAAGGSASGGTTAAGGSGSGGMAGGGQAGSSAQGGSGGGTQVNCSAQPLTGGTQHCSSNASGTANSYTWTIWSSGSGGCMTTYGTGAAYKATWNNSGDFLAREGFQWDETKTYDQLGTISADFAYTKTGTGGGYSFIGIYGWSNNPLVEYYIVEDWYGSGPPTGGGAKQGTLDVDGATYDIYTHTQNNQPSIHGTATFPQFFSVRRTARQCGHISISEHFKKWGSLGMNLGKMYEAKILVEVGGGSGSIDFSTASMTAK